jgi:hypothetical protein
MLHQNRPGKERDVLLLRGRILGQFLSEVTEDDELLSWFLGDELWPNCLRAGFWA